MRKSPYTLSPATPGDLRELRKLVHEAARWLRENKHTDQWAKPWPDRAGQKKRMRDDLIKGKTWFVWDGAIVAGTITLDPEEPLTASGRPLWPTRRRHELAVYVRRVIVGRAYAGLGIGSALLDWAAGVAKRNHGAMLIRIDVWTTNLDLQDYYERQRFIRCDGKDPAELGDYPAQALFERTEDQAGSAHTDLFVEARSPHGRYSRRRVRMNRSRRNGTG